MWFFCFDGCCDLDVVLLVICCNRDGLYVWGCVFCFIGKFNVSLLFCFFFLVVIFSWRFFFRGRDWMLIFIFCCCGWFFVVDGWFMVGRGRFVRVFVDCDVMYLLIELFFCWVLLLFINMLLISFFWVFFGMVIVIFGCFFCLFCCDFFWLFWSFVRNL